MHDCNGKIYSMHAVAAHACSADVRLSIPMPAPRDLYASPSRVVSMPALAYSRAGGGGGGGTCNGSTHDRPGSRFLTANIWP